MKVRRTIFKQELAVKLYPDSINPQAAMQLLRKEINRTPKLKERLYETQLKSNTPYFTHLQFQLILKHYGVEIEEYEQL